MQDRSSAVALLLVLAICCLGMYVAVSGYLNSTPQKVSLPTQPSVLPGTLVVLVIDTETPAPKLATASAPTSTAQPIPSPLGVIATETSSVTQSPVISMTATLKPTAPPATLTPAGLNVPCGGLAFCPSGGPPDPQFAPNSQPCPSNYIWGRVTDARGIGIVGAKVAFRIPYAGTDKVETKGPPDPAGVYNIVTGPSAGPWTLWLLDSSGGRGSPDVTIMAPQNYSGSGNCPTRVDFRAQR